ncbi:hypothetical protein ACFVJM_38150 [Streptomyces virginiae]|uniref:hypothetical protein n=1 Tax=Streptomyces virginiae TaxID=1961 RepID=UPI003637407A
MSGHRARLRPDRLGTVLAAFWAAGHVAAGALLVQAADTNTTAAANPAATRPDLPAEDDDAHTFRCGPRTDL